MVNIFEMVVTKLLEVGFYDFLIFVIALALFYGILKKIKLFESHMVTSVLAFCIAFLIFGYPVLVNYSMVMPLTNFFTQSFLFILVFFVMILMATFFYPDLPKFLAEQFTSRSMLFVGLAIGVAIAIMSGSVSMLWTTVAPGGATRPVAPSETSTVAAAVVVFVLLLIVAGSISLRGGG